MQVKTRQAQKISLNTLSTHVSSFTKTIAFTAVAGALALGSVSVASAQDKAAAPKAAAAEPFITKVGFVNTQRILSDSEPAKSAQKKIEAEFEKRNQELQKSVDKLREQALKFEKDAPVMPESDRNRRQRELGNMEADLQRKQREIQEDFNRRRNEEFSDIIESANVAIKAIAEEDQWDLIIQDAVTVSPRVDITDKVMERLSKKK